MPVGGRDAQGSVMERVVLGSLSALGGIAYSVL